MKAGYFVIGAYSTLSATSWLSEALGVKEPVTASISVAVCILFSFIAVFTFRSMKG